jgi:hypothetical protein
MNYHGKRNPRHGVGRGLVETDRPATTQALQHQIRRQFAHVKAEQFIQHWALKPANDNCIVMRREAHRGTR